MRGTIDVDVEAATAAWNEALETTPWDRPPVWIHGDLHSGNLLVVDGRVSAVIDFGGLAVGDPACDLCTEGAAILGRFRTGHHPW